MARTAEGAILSTRHRNAQLEIRAGALRDFMRLWPVWDGDEASFRRLIEASLPLIRQYHSVSAATATSYYEDFRRLERPGGSPTPVIAPLDDESVIGGLYVTGVRMTRDALNSGQSPEAAMRTALVRVSGSVTRQVLNGGRHSIVLSTASDRQAGGWARVTADTPCAFCALLASRGPVFSEYTVGFDAHDHCSCAGEPHYRDSEWPGRAGEWRDLYNKVAEGTDNPINEFRRALSGAVG